VLTDILETCAHHLAPEIYTIGQSKSGIRRVKTYLTFARNEKKAVFSDSKITRLASDTLFVRIRNEKLSFV
jgi:hypothetical protein